MATPKTRPATSKERAIMAALLNEDYALAGELFAAGGVNLDAEVQPGVPLLKRFVAMGDPAGVSWLLDHGAQPDARMYGQSPMFFAARDGDQLLCEQLLERGADINRPGPNGMSPIYAAAWNGHMELFDWFINQQASTTMLDRDGHDVFVVAGKRLGYDSAGIAEMRKSCLERAARLAVETMQKEPAPVLTEDEQALREIVQQRATRRRL